MSESDLVLDQSKIGNEGGDAYVFQFLSGALRAIKALSLEDVKPQVATFESTLLSIALATTPFSTAPGRPVRLLTAQCLVAIYSKGETKGLFDTINKLLVAAGDAKEKESTRVSAFFCLGELMGTHGSQVMSFMTEITNSAMRTYRATSSAPILRYHAISALSKAISNAGKAISDQAVKDLHKNMRAALLDKALSVQRAAAATLIALYPNSLHKPISSSASPSILSAAEIETILAQVVKAFDGADIDTSTRLALARLIGHMLATTQVPRAVAASTSKATNSTSQQDDSASLGAKSQPEIASKPLMPPAEMFMMLSTWMNKQSSTRRQRVGLLQAYAALLNILGASWVENHYALVIGHLSKDLIVTPKVTASSKAERVWTRRAVGIILRDVVRERMLSEQGLISAVMEVVNGFLRPYLSAVLFSGGSRPQSPSAGSSTSAFIKGQSSERPPSTDTMIIVLHELCGLLQQLGNTPPVIHELLGGGEVLVAVACSAPGGGVRGAAVSALCAFVRACPGGLGPIMESIYEGVKRDITTLNTIASQIGNSSTSSSNLPSLPEVKARALGHAYCIHGIYTLLATPNEDVDASNRRTESASSTSPANLAVTSLHLHVPPISPMVLHTATSLLKSTFDLPLPVARITSEIGWTLLSGLMALGPHFVRSNLSALMVLWRNALPKPTVRDNSSVVGKEEWGFLLGVRGWAVGAMCSFLKWNNLPISGDPGASGDRSMSKVLVTLDISRRLGVLLSNALGFANLFITAQKEEILDPTSPTAPSLNSAAQVDEDGHDLHAYEALLRSHIHVAFTLLGFATTTESIQRELITSSISLFAAHANYSGSGLQVAIAAKEGSFKGVWRSEDGYAYGVTSLDLAEEALNETGTQTGGTAGNGLPQASTGLQYDIAERELDKLLTLPVLGSPENDPLALSSTSTEPQVLFTPVPPVTAVVDSAINLYAALLCIQDSNGSLKAIGGLIDAAKGSGERATAINMGRKMAMTINAVSAIVLSLRHVMGRSGGRAAKEVFGGAQVANMLSNFLKDAILDPDETLRGLASEALGRLTSLSSSTFLGNQINNLVQEVVNNRDPLSRAGCTSAFGAIYIYAGGLAAQAYLKTVLNVLISLSNDPHPVVHYWSLQALGQVIAASSLSYGPYISNTIALVFKVYSMESHEPEGGSLSQANLSADLPTYQALCRILDGVISAIGPELQESSKYRRRISDLVFAFLEYEDEGVGVEAIQCLRQMLMFAPSKMDMVDLVTRFKTYLASPRRPLKVASINALYQLVQRDAFLLSKVGGDKLVEVLFGMLDEEDSLSIEGVKSIIISWLTQTVTAAPSAWIELCQRIMARTTAAAQQAVPPTTGPKAGAFQDEESESLGASGAQNEGGSGHSTARWRTQLFAMDCLHRICLVVAASGRQEHLDLRFAKQHSIAVKGLLVSRIPDLVKMAFSASAAYVTEIRLAGLLVLRDVIQIFATSPDPDYDGSLLLEQYQAPITAALTPAFSSDSTPEILSSAVQVCAIFVGCGVIKDVNKMGRILKLLTGALEQSKSSNSFTIGDVKQISPNAAVTLKISTLTAWAELYIASPQQEYLKAVIEPYRETLSSLWIGILRDYASIRGDSEVLQDPTSSSMDGLYLNVGKEILLPYYDDAWYRILKAIAIMMQSRDPFILRAMDGKEGPGEPAPEGPTALFFVVFGLVFEALVQSSTNAASSASGRLVTIAALEAMESLVRPEYAGSAILDNTIFEEFSNLCYRMAMMETAEVHIPLVKTVASLASTQFKKTSIGNGTSSGMSSTVQLTHCLRICSYVLRRALPSSGTPSSTANSETKITLLKTSFAALGQIGTAFGSDTKEDIRGISIALYSELLKDEISEQDLVGPSLPALKLMLESPPHTANRLETYSRLIHGLLSCCLQNIDETSNRSGPIVTLKTKNNLMASVLILTTLPPTLKISRALIDQYCYLVSQRMSDGSDCTLTAAQCAKTLITASLAPTTNPVLKHCAGLLIPSLIGVVSNAATCVDSQEKLAAVTPALDEALKTFTLFFNGVPEASRQAALGVILPTLALLLDPSRTPPSPLHAQAIPLVLNFASSAPGPFKEVTDGLDTGAREVLEASVRQVVAGRQQASTAQVAAKPQISLKAF